MCVGRLLFAASVALAVPFSWASAAQAPQEQVATEALEALGSIDSARLFADPAYAEKILGVIASVEPGFAGDKEREVALRNLKAFALIGSGRADEAEALAAATLAAHPLRADAYTTRLIVAMIRGRHGDALAVIETAARHGSDRRFRAELAELFDREAVFGLSRAFAAAKDVSSQARLAEALVALDWQTRTRPSLSDTFKLLAINGRLKRGDADGARALAAEVDTPRAVLELMVARKYDPLFETGVDRVGRFRQALDLEAARTGRNVQEKPRDYDTVVERSQHLRSLGRNAEAVALAEPLIADLAAVEAAGEPAFWLVNEAAFALLALGRGDEALASMNRLLTLDIERHPDLVNMSINRGEILNRTGRFREAEAHAASVLASQGKYASDYGEMWIAEAAVCGLAGDNRIGEAGVWLDRLRLDGEKNQAALMRALLCANDMEGAERLMLKRLAEEDPTPALVAAQTYSIVDRHSAQRRTIDERYEALLRRPAVRAAIDKVGRVLVLPGARTYWGEF